MLYRKWKYILMVIVCLLGGRFILAAEVDDNITGLSMDYAIDQALIYDLTLKQSAEDVEIAEKQLKNSQKTISFSGGIAQTNHSITDNRVLAKSLDITNGKRIEASLNINPQWSINMLRDATDGNLCQVGITYFPFQFKQLIDIKQKEVQLASKISDYEQTKVKLIAEVQNAYVDIIQKIRLLDCGKENLFLATEHCKHVQSRYNLGKVLEIDLTEAKQQVKIAEIYITSAELQVKRSILKLNKLTGLNLSSNLKLDETNLAWINPEQVDFEAVQSGCLTNSPELEVAEMNIQFYELQNKVSKLQGASGWGITLNRQWEEYYSLYEDKIFSLTLHGNSIYEQARKGQKEIADLNLEKSKKAKVNYLSQTVRELEQAYKDWQITNLSLQPKKEVINLAKEKLRITRLKFDMGLAAATDVNDARGTLLQMERDYWNAWVELQNARIKFYSASWGAIIYKQKP